MKFIEKFLILILFVSCSKKGNTLKEYANYPVKFAKQKINHPSNDFSVFIPKNWKWKVEKYNTENNILGIEATSELNKNGFKDIISIQKIKSFGENKDLKSEFKYSLETIENNLGEKTILESGFTKILNENAYFVHTESNTETYGKVESISLIIESNKKGEFYNLNALLSEKNEKKKNMAILINCLLTFEKLKK